MKFLDSFDRYLLADDRWDRRSHYASDVSACRRELYFKWTGEPYSDPPNAGARLKMAFGKGAENIIGAGLKWMQQKGEIKGYASQVKYEAHLPELKYPVGIRLDFVIEQTDDPPLILEIKSAYGRGIKEIQKDGRPRDDHLMQIFLYLQYTPIKQALAVYLGRDNGYRTEFALWLNDGQVMLDGKAIGAAQEGVDWVAKRLKAVEDHLEAKTLPDRDFYHAIKNGELRDEFQKAGQIYKSDWHCSYCWFRSTCWADVVKATAEGGDNGEMKR